jgi:hypothetical protein
MTSQTQRQFARRWSRARDEAFDAGRQFMPTNFAPKGSQWHRPHGQA